MNKKLLTLLLSAALLTSGIPCVKSQANSILTTTNNEMSAEEPAAIIDDERLSEEATPSVDNTISNSTLSFEPSVPTIKKDAEKTAAPTVTPTSTPEPTSTPAPTPQPVQQKDFLTGNTYVHNAAFAKKTVYTGIDVSYHQGAIDFKKVKAAGVSFVIIRVGYRGSSTGNISVDPKFKTYAKDATDAGLKIGLYFYSEAINASEAKAEAQFCIEKAKDYKITLPIAYDFEPSTNKGRQYKANLSKAKATTLCTTFCDTIKTAGYSPMIYASSSTFNNDLNRSTLAKSYKLWVARYPTTSRNVTGKTYKNADDPDYTYWQYASIGKVDGISGKVDCNFRYVSSDTPKTSITKTTISYPTKKTYTGEKISPTVTIKYNNKKLVKNTDYTVSYSNNKAVGTANITIKGKGSYSGTIKKTFQIIPSKVGSLKATSGKKAITLSWKKNSSATRYLIYRKSDYNSSKYTKVKSISKNTTIKWQDTGLSADREYFYAIRTCTIVGSKKYYGNYKYITANTLAANGKTQKIVTADTPLYELPTLEGEAKITIPKNTSVAYYGKMYLSDKAFVYHVKYTVNKVTYDGYLDSETVFQP